MRLQAGDGSSKDIPTDSEGTLTGMADLTSVRRGLSLLRGEELFLDSCVLELHVFWQTGHQSRLNQADLDGDPSSGGYVR